MDGEFDSSRNLDPSSWSLADEYSNTKKKFDFGFLGMTPTRAEQNFWKCVQTDRQHQDDVESNRARNALIADFRTNFYGMFFVNHISFVMFLVCFFRIGRKLCSSLFKTKVLFLCQCFLVFVFINVIAKEDSKNFVFYIFIIMICNNLSAFLFTASLLGSHVEAFVPTNFVSIARPSLVKPIYASTLESPTVEDSTKAPTSWECDDDLTECKEVPACDEEACRTSLDVRIHGEWYDLSGWRKAHPAGDHWIDWYDGRDATEVMDGFHSLKGREMYKRLPKSAESTVQALEQTVPPDSSTQIAFRKLREELEAEGYWERDMGHEARLLGIWGSLVVGAALTVNSVPLLSTFCLGLSMTAAGWLGHDYIHGIDKFSDRLRNFAGFAAGLQPTWWSDKHNKHHALSEFWILKGFVGLEIF